MSGRSGSEEFGRRSRIVCPAAHRLAQPRIPQPQDPSPFSDRFSERSELCGARILGDVLGGWRLAGASHQGFLRIAEGEPGEVEVVVMTVAAINRCL